MPVFVGLAFGLALPLYMPGMGVPPMLPFVLAVLGAAALGGLGPGLVATAASLAVVASPVLDDETVWLSTAQVAYRAALFVAIGVALSGTFALMGRQRERLLAARDRMTLVADNAPVMLAHLDRERRYLFVSKHYCEHLGLEPSQVIGRTIADMLGAHAYVQLAWPIERALRGERVEFEQEIPYDTIGPRFMHVAYVPDRAPDGTVRGLFAAITDITERRRLEDRLRDADRRKDRYLAVLSHELRNPLAPIRIATHLLSRVDADALPQPAAGVVASTVPMLRRQVAHLTRLVDDLLDATRISRGAIVLERTPTSVAAAIQVALDATREVVDARDHRLEVTLPTPDAIVDVDPARLSQVVANLLQNAAKYTPRGGHLSCRVALDPGGTMLTIEVGDDGIGIARDRVDRIFEMFTQAEQRPVDLAESGLGIGLALVRELVTLHGGTVHARSAGLGRGSTFVVRLPVGRGGVAPVEPSRVEPSRAASSRVGSSQAAPSRVEPPHTQPSSIDPTTVDAARQAA